MEPVKNILDLLFGEVGNGVAGVDDHGDAIGAQDVILEFHAVEFGLLLFILIDVAGSGGDIANARNKAPIARGAAFGVEAQGDLRMQLFVFGDQPGGQFFADGIRTFDNDLVGACRGNLGLLLLRWTSGYQNREQNQAGFDPGTAPPRPRAFIETHIHDGPLWALNDGPIICLPANQIKNEFGAARALRRH